MVRYNIHKPLANTWQDAVEVAFFSLSFQKQVQAVHMKSAI